MAQRGIRKTLFLCGCQKTTLSAQNVYYSKEKVFNKYVSLSIKLLQGADDKLGKFLDQDIEASANHRNVLRHFEKLSISGFTLYKQTINIYKKYVGWIQNLSSSPKSFARQKKSTGNCKASKSAQVPDLSFEESFKPKPGCWGGSCHSCPKLKQKRFFWPHTKSGFCGLATQNTAKITLDWPKANLMNHCPRKSGLPAQN